MKNNQDYRREVQRKENLLMQETSLTLMTDFDETVLDNTVMDSSVLKKRPSNPAMQNEQQRPSQRQSHNIFAAKERVSSTMKDGLDRKSMKPNKENSEQRKSHMQEMNEAAKIVARRMKQMELE